MLETALTSSVHNLSLDQIVSLLCYHYPTFILENISSELKRYISIENSSIKQLIHHLNTTVGCDVNLYGYYILLNVLNSCPYSFTLQTIHKRMDTKKGFLFSLEDEITINLQALKQYQENLKNKIVSHDNDNDENDDMNSSSNNNSKNKKQNNDKKLNTSSSSRGRKMNTFSQNTRIKAAMLRMSELDTLRLIKGKMNIQKPALHPLFTEADKNDDMSNDKVDNDMSNDNDMSDGNDNNSSISNNNNNNNNNNHIGSGNINNSNINNNSNSNSLDDITDKASIVDTNNDSSDNTSRRKRKSKSEGTICYDSVEINSMNTTTTTTTNPSSLSSSSLSSSSSSNEESKMNSLETKEAVKKNINNSKKKTIKKKESSSSSSSSSLSSPTITTTTTTKKKNKNKIPELPQEVLEATLFEELDRMAKNVIMKFTSKSRLNVTISCMYNEYQAERDCHHVSAFTSSGGSSGSSSSGYENDRWKMNQYMEDSFNESVYLNDTHDTHNNSNNDSSSSNTSSSSSNNSSMNTYDDNTNSTLNYYNSSSSSSSSSLRREPINFRHFVEINDSIQLRLNRMLRSQYRNNYSPVDYSSSHNNSSSNSSNYSSSNSQYNHNSSSSSSSSHSHNSRHLLNEAANFNVFTDELGVYSNDPDDEHLHSNSNNNYNHHYHTNNNSNNHNNINNNYNSNNRNSNSNNSDNNNNNHHHHHHHHHHHYEDKSIYKVFVTEIPSGVTRRDIFNVFRKVGNVIDVVDVPNTELNREEYASYLTKLQQSKESEVNDRHDDTTHDDNSGSSSNSSSGNDSSSNSSSGNDSSSITDSIVNAENVITSIHNSTEIPSTTSTTTTTNATTTTEGGGDVQNTINNALNKHETTSHDPLVLDATSQRINKLRHLINPHPQQHQPKKIIRHYRPDGHAFVFFENRQSYELAIGDDFRILGINLKGTNCYVHSAHLSTTLYIEFLQVISTENVINILKLVFGEQWEYTVRESQYEDLNPLFVHLKFRTHQEAWESYKRLDQEPGIYDIIHITWCKSTWYRAVAKKEKDYSYDRQDCQARNEVEEMKQQRLLESSSASSSSSSSSSLLLGNIDSNNNNLQKNRSSSNNSNNEIESITMNANNATTTPLSPTTTTTTTTTGTTVTTSVSQDITTPAQLLAQSL